MRCKKFIIPRRELRQSISTLDRSLCSVTCDHCVTIETCSFCYGQGSAIEIVPEIGDERTFTRARREFSKPHATLSHNLIINTQI